MEGESNFDFCELRNMKTYIGEVPILGRGVYAAKNLKKGEVIERCPVIVCPQEEVGYLDKTRLRTYYYMWGKGNDKAAIVLGHGFFYNHSYEPNARYVKDLEHETMLFLCIADVNKGEEIRINYNGDPDSKSPMWFEVI